MGSQFCQQHPGSGEIIFNVITASAETNSQFNSLQCPQRINETDFEAKMLVFGSQLQTTVANTINYQEPAVGSDIVGAILYGATQTFERFKPKYRYLVVFSDMQQFGDGVRSCIKKSGVSLAATCLGLYFRKNPELDGKRPELQNTAVFVIGVGQTVSGSINTPELVDYQAFWTSFFKREHAKICWFAPANMPVTTNSDGTQSISAKYFNADCPPIPGF